MVKKNIRLKSHLGNGVYDTLHPETNSEIVRVGDKNLDDTLGDVSAQLAQKATRESLNVEKSRIDTIISLPETAGINNARLEDIAVGVDGVVYTSPGNAVRAIAEGSALLVGGKSYATALNDTNGIETSGLIGEGSVANVSFTRDVGAYGSIYKIDTTASFAEIGRPQFTLFPFIRFSLAAEPNVTKDLKIEFDNDISAPITLVVTIMDTTTAILSTKYFDVNPNENTTIINLPKEDLVGAKIIRVRQFAFKNKITGKHHAYFENFSIYLDGEKPTNLKKKLDELYKKNDKNTRDLSLINNRVSDIEGNKNKSYFILDFDYGPTSWSDLNITTVLDEYGYPFKFNFSPSADPDIAWSLVRRGCEMSTYFNDSTYLPTDAQFNSTDSVDQLKVDEYVKQALRMQYALDFRDQITWSTRQFTTGVALEKSLKKYGFAIQRLRGGLRLLPTEVKRNQLTQFFVSDNTTNWYEHTLEGIDLAIQNGGSLAIFTHKLVASDDSSGLNITVAQYKLILNKIKNYVDAGMAEVITYKDYFEKFSR